jgi:two-component system, chemotaxis family, sensor kinase CheA
VSMDPVDLALLWDVFHAEADEGLAAMESELLAVDGGAAPEDAVPTLFRLAHTLKGNASSMGLTELTEMAHAVEGVLERLRSHAEPVSEDVVGTLLSAVDALREMLADTRRSRQ